MLVATADACSASRPGARRESLERYIKRMEELESIARGFDGVEQAFAIQAGRELRVIASARDTDDAKAAKICHDIAKAFEQQLTYPGEIKVTVVRESRFVESRGDRNAAAATAIGRLPAPGSDWRYRWQTRDADRMRCGSLVAAHDGDRCHRGQCRECGGWFRASLHRLPALIQSGISVITLGDHLYRKREIMEPLNNEQNIIRPANLPERAPGRGSTTFTARDGIQVGVINLIGRVFMKPVDCPFRAADVELGKLPDGCRLSLVDFHAEATSDKQLMGRYLDGRVSAVLGTHTHVATADEQILPGGTAFSAMSE